MLDADSRGEPRDGVRARLDGPLIERIRGAGISLPALAVAAAVAIAVADSSIVVLALPDLYGAFNTSIEGVAWVITSYNVVVAIAAFLLLPFARRVRPARLTAAGLGLFLAASIGCAASSSIVMLIGFRCAQGLGAALLLAGSLRLLGAMLASAERGAALWIAAGTVGVAVGPALGGVLTQLFDWRAIFVAQVPVAALALWGAIGVSVPAGAESAPIGRRAVAANVGLGLVFAALVGALFLAVLLVITVWGLTPIEGALVVSALPVAALVSRPLAGALAARTAVGGGAALLALALLVLAFMPARSSVLAAAALALCGVGLGLVVPTLTRLALGREAGDTRSGLLTIGVRHAGLVCALVLLAPLLTHTLVGGGERATRAGAAAILDADVPLTKKVPLALELRDALDSAPRGQVPDLSGPFDRLGAGSNAGLRRLESDLVGTLEDVLTRSFRPAFALCALFAALALIPLAWLDRRQE